MNKTINESTDQFHHYSHIVLGSKDLLRVIILISYISASRVYLCEYTLNSDRLDRRILYKELLNLDIDPRSIFL